MDPGHKARKTPSDNADLGFQAVGPALRIMQLNVEGLSAAKRIREEEEEYVIRISRLDSCSYSSITAWLTINGQLTKTIILHALFSCDFQVQKCTKFKFFPSLSWQPRSDLRHPGGAKFWYSDWRLLCKLHKIWSVDYQDHQLNCCHQMSDFKAEMHQIRFRLGPRWGSLQRSTRPHSCV